MKYLIILSLFISSIFSEELITPIPDSVQYHKQKAILGKKLFFDTRLSRNNTISCATCHIIDQGGDDNLPVSFGINGQKGTRNAPTVLNAKFNILQFWDGRAKDLKEQAKGPIHNPIEMDSNFDEVSEKLKQDSSYVEAFEAIYSDSITGENIIDAIAEYENTLITPHSPFDKYLKGDTTALTKQELNGYKLFKEYGCISCHNGVNIGGNLMQKIGVLEKFKTEDYGRYNITKKIEDKYYFKVPTLRNIQLTSPYFHDGKTPTLNDAVKKMSFYQIGYELTEKETEDIVSFLKTLTGKQDFD